MNSVNFQDLKTAYKYKSTADLKLTYFIFNTLQKPILLRMLKGCANGIVKYNLPFKAIIKKTIFKLFCAGETIDEAFQLIKYLDTYQVKSVLDYVNEGEKSEAAFEVNTKIIVSNIQRVGKECPNNYISVKITGLEDTEFLGKCNARQFPTDATLKPRFDKLYERIDLICSTAKESNVVIYIDAEDRYMQDIIDVIVEAMMEKYNKEKVVVFNTLQMYLKDRVNYLENLIANAKQKQYTPGIKLVRGAYVEKERESAKKENRESPVFDTKEQTDKSFNTAVELCLSNHANIATCIASHNYASTQLAIDCIQKYNITDVQNKVRFSQLYGMCDGITFNLAASGYSVSKYLPYGEVKKAIPYLIRRSEENTSINGQINDELNKLKTEINNRKTNK
ncbi:MAG: proline dehydrogenase family protein [Bacteroidetes bacterium]|nr:proline dehydrogenase family protein [Bacteroidota bacterium]